MILSMVTAPFREAARASAPAVGRNETHWPGLTLFRAVEPMPRMAMVYDPCVCFVAEGSKRVHLGGKTYTYDPNHFLVVSLSLPIEAEIPKATPDHPLLSLVLEVDVAEVGRLLLEMEEDASPVSRRPRPGLFVSEMHDELADALTRMLAIAADKTRSRVLGAGAMREILYHLLVGDQGQRLRELALQSGSSRSVARVVRHLEERFAEPIDVATLAGMVGMSASTLHRAFKEVTALSPIQYLKTVRLHRARVLMVTDGLNAGEAAYKVGYQSQSQFSREFKRLFGAPPSEVLRNMRREAVSAR